MMSVLLSLRDGTHSQDKETLGWSIDMTYKRQGQHILFAAGSALPPSVSQAEK